MTAIPMMSQPLRREDSSELFVKHVTHSDSLVEEELSSIKEVITPWMQTAIKAEAVILHDQNKYTDEILNSKVFNYAYVAKKIVGKLNEQCWSETPLTRSSEDKSSIFTEVLVCYDRSSQASNLEGCLIFTYDPKDKVMLLEYVITNFKNLGFPLAGFQEVCLKGIGKELVQTAKERCLSLGLNSIQLAVLDGVKGFYSSLGFEPLEDGDFMEIKAEAIPRTLQNRVSILNEKVA